MMKSCRTVFSDMEKHYLKVMWCPNPLYRQEIVSFVYFFIIIFENVKTGRVSFLES